MRSDIRAKSSREMRKENAFLWTRLQESEELVRAIRHGEIDALFTAHDCGGRILTVGRADSAHRTLVEAMSEGAAVLIDKGIVIYCNGRLADMLKAPLERVIGCSLFDFIAAEERESVASLVGKGKSASCRVDTTFCRSDGTTGPVQLSLSPMLSEGLATTCVVVTDLTARNLAREELRNLSLIDELTGLSNRRAFLAVAQPHLTLARRLQTEVVLVFLDLDEFKAINDRLGHQQGDHALMDVANLLRNTYRESDIIARLGGDEFVVLAAGSSEMTMDTLAARLQTNLEVLNGTGQRPYRLAMSVGMVRCECENPKPIAELLLLADAAMYEQKRAKRDAQARGADASPYLSVELPA
jgi:diguanylate cyclase (GGDEF)-like protein/PAS domain S-box-containing protein